MKPEISTFHLTNHAKRRSAQRSIKSDALSLVVQFGESHPAGDGCERRVLNRSAAEELIADGVNADLVSNAQKMAAIVSPDEAVITTYFCSARDIKKYKQAA